MGKISRRSFLSSAAIAMATAPIIVSVGCAPASTPTPTAEPTKAPASAQAATPTAAAKTTDAANSAASSGGDIVIAFTCPVTGASAAEGALQLKAIKLALKQINAAGVNGKKINLLIEDNQSSNPGELAALNKSVEQDKALALMGPVKSTQILAMSDAVKGYAIPTIVGGTNVTITQQGNPWLFRVRPNDGVAGLAMVKYISEDMKLSKVGILHDTDAFGTGGADIVEKASKDASLSVVAREKYTTKDKDFTAQLQKLKGAGAEVMALYGTNPEDVAVIIKQWRQIGSPFKYIGSVSSGSKDTLNLAKADAEGIVAAADWVPGATDSSKKYMDDYKKEYNEDMDPSSAWAYDGLNILVEGIRKGGEDRTKIKDAILAIKGYQGVLGTFSFTPTGEGLSQCAVVQIENGQQKLLKVVSVSQ